MDPEQDETHVDSKTQTVPSVVIQIWQFTVEIEVAIEFEVELGLNLTVRNLNLPEQKSDQI